jgi:hypothetical protein
MLSVEHSERFRLERFLQLCGEDPDVLPHEDEFLPMHQLDKMKNTHKKRKKWWTRELKMLKAEVDQLYKLNKKAIKDNINRDTNIKLIIKEKKRISGFINELGYIINN